MLNGLRGRIERARSGWRELPLRHGLKLVWESSAGWTVLRVFIIVLQGLLPLASLYLMKLIVDALAAAMTPGGDAVDPTRVLWLVAAAAAISLLTAGARLAGTLVTETQGLAVTDHVLDMLQAKSVEVDLQYYENPRYHDTLHRAQEQAPFRPTHIVQQLAQIGYNAVTLLALGGLLIAFQWWIAAVLFLAVIPAALVRARFAVRAYDWQRRQTAAQRQARYFNTIVTGEPFAKELRLFDLGTVFRDRFRAINRRVRRERLDLVARRTGFEFVAFAAATAAVFASFAYIAYAAVQRAISIGDVVMYFGAFQRAQDAFRELLTAVTALYEDNLFLGDLAEFFALQPLVGEPSRPLPVPRPFRRGITFENVSFRYPGSENDVLTDVTLAIRPGEHIALVGENGSGKTTLVKLLCRLYDPTEGAIRIDGHDVRAFSSSAFRREISVVFQDYARYQLTAEENIWLGNVHAPMDRQTIVDAAKRTGADAVIARLKSGYATQLGKSFADGTELSIGEWQKIALTRAFLRDSQILVMDEPTSALDAWAEFQVYQQFQQLARGRTAILISHRLSAMRTIDRIYVLDRGRIVECGGHDELLERGGTYARLFEVQARYYR